MAIDVRSNHDTPPPPAPPPAVTQPDETRRPAALAIGAPVACRDGRVGTLERVLFDRGTGRVQYLVIASGFPRHRDVVVPVGFLDAASDDVATLKLTREEFARLRSRAPGVLETSEIAGLSVAPPPTPQPAREVRAIGPARAIEKGAAVWCEDGQVGVVERVLLGADGAATGLVVRSGRWFPTRRRVPAAWIDAAADDVVLLRASRAALAGQPEYREDAAILADVRARLEDDDPIRTVGLRHAAITVEQGRVTLSGYVPSRSMARRMADLARSAPGVLSVAERLVADDELERAVAAAIGRSPLNRTSRLSVHAEGGRVTVGGVFPSHEAKEAALRIAEAVPGVAAAAEGPAAIEPPTTA
jgi:osmotically-inducible protein OsmY/uncharacterized protein YrrD